MLSSQFSRGGAVKEGQHRSRGVVCFDIAYIHWRVEFAPFETDCFDTVCEFVREHLDSLVDRYYGAGYKSLNEFPGWALERYLRQVAARGARHEKGA